MSRVGTSIRVLSEAVSGGVPELAPDEAFAAFAQLWVQRRVDLGHPADSARRAVADGRLREAALSSDVVVQLAVCAGEIRGFAWVAVRPLSTLLDSPGVTIEDMYVDPDRRRHGTAKALLVAAGTLSQRNGGDQIACVAPTHARTLNRVLARLGFVPAATSRVASSSALLRRLRGGSSPRDAVLLRRRTHRARLAAEGVALAR
ncbi:GNAT family N-acetyltransferase [Agilicoccus flavus]|uniref:GNAT family N-acetyltransferase n=1 Tax=Agilicoccus flavus TaxID=2775968 RepID=UPI001CF717EF|nr:GNAT family N-acetyltransferase [Agilicoccus flavus]